MMAPFSGREAKASVATNTSTCGEKRAPQRTPSVDADEGGAGAPAAGPAVMAPGLP